MPGITTMTGLPQFAPHIRKSFSAVFTKSIRFLFKLLLTTTEQHPMKVLLATAVLLISAQYVISAALGRPKREEENIEISDEKKDKIVDIFNKGRKEMAKALHISNMHKLTWDEGLEDKVEHFNCGRGLEAEVKDLMNQVDGKDFEEGLKILDKFAQRTILGCFDPVQTEIACIVRKCETDDQPFVNCVCGPENGFSKSNVKKGDPGSDCDETDDDDLCDDNSSTHASAGILINLIAFYLLASFVL
ncbi:unnamed protein product [Caenorhabditis brenneri]